MQNLIKKLFFLFTFLSLGLLSKVSAQVTVVGDEGGLFDDFTFDIFTPRNFVDGGIYAVAAYFASLIFSVLLVVWIVVIIMGVYKIISSQGEEGQLKEGYTAIKNVFIGLTMGLVFFVVLSLVGVFFGFGNVYQWADKLSMCRLGAAPVAGAVRDELKFQAENKLEAQGIEFTDLTCNKQLGWVTVESGIPAE